MNIDAGLIHLSSVDPKMEKLINKFEKPKNYRIQGEFGQKKFIKP